ncbi:ferrochelatase, partial [Saccharomonospora iraqiensis]|uniref:ferrochelatase n=1 Tax=Saccharomonospora iraqiensis TaxID=52698 RepID=UPI00047AEEF9
MNYDALLWLSFGGPEGEDEVLPFLENVTRGRGVPRERLEEVAEHYHRFGGVSPINRLNREAIAAVERELAEQGLSLPVYFGNRNWHPMVEDTVARMADDGVRNALVFATSAYGGYSACRQYDEDIARARAAVGERAPHLRKLRHFFDHPLFVGALADGVRAAYERLGDPGARLVFTAHSVPL